MQDERPGNDIPTSPAWSRNAQAIAAVLWPAFLAACLATMIFFAFVDPAEFGSVILPPVEWSRMTGYAVGFFFFWGITLAASGVTAYLLHTAHDEQP